jgi:hypothetical protein
MFLHEFSAPVRWVFIGWGNEVIRILVRRSDQKDPAGLRQDLTAALPN